MPLLKVFGYQNSYNLVTIILPSDFILGAPVEIGQLPNLQHGVRGTLYAVDETTFFIEDFEYDGQGPGWLT